MTAHGSSPRCLIAVIAHLAVALLLAATPAVAAGEDAVDWDLVKEHFENWVGAASAGLPASAGAAATSLSAMPQGTKNGLLFRCHANMVRADDELQDPGIDAARRDELRVLLDKNQAVIDALDGKPENLRAILAKQQGTGGTPASAPAADSAAAMRADEEEFMRGLLARYRSAIEDLRVQAAAQHRRFEALHDEAVKLDREIYEIGYWAVDQRSLVRLEDALLAQICVDLAEVEKRAQAYAVSVLDGETRCRQALAEAERLAADCRSPADAALIRQRYEEAKRDAARMTPDLEESRGEALKRQRLVEGITDNDAPARLADAHGKADAMLQKLAGYRKTIESTLALRDEPLSALAELERQADELRTTIRESRTYYVQEFPHSKDSWDELVYELSADLVFKAPDPEMAAVNWLEHAMTARRQIEALQAMTVTAASCSGDQRTDLIIERAQTARDLTLLRLGASEHVLAAADACGQSTPAPPPASGQPPASPAPTPAAPAIQLLPTTAPAGPALAGGLRIQGPSKLLPKQVVRYVGTDGAGTPYPDGVTWNTSDETVLVIGADGSGVVKKPGTATIIAHHGDKTAFLDVAIWAVVPDVTTMPLEQALGVLEHAGLRGVPKGFSAAGTSGAEVTRQSLEKGSAHPAGTRVLLDTSAGASAAGTADAAAADGSTTALFSTSGGEAVGPAAGSPTAASGATTAPADDCSAAEATFNNALAIGDLRWAQSVLAGSRDCGFFDRAQAALEAESIRVAAETAAADADRERQRCDQLRNQFEGAMATGNWRDAQAVLQTAEGCDFQTAGLTRLQQAVQAAVCQQLYQQYLQHMAGGAAHLASAALQIAQTRNCNVPAADVNAVNQALAQQQAQSLQDQRDQEQQQIQLFNALMQATNSVIQSQQGGGATSGLSGNRLPPPGGSTLPATGGPSGDPVNSGWLPSTTIRPPAPTTTGSGGGPPPAGPPAGTGRSRAECERQYCPMCADPVDLLQQSADPRCNACRTQYADEIRACMSGN